MGWIIFRAENIHQAWDYLVCMVTKFEFVMPESGRAYGKKAMLYIALLLLIEWLQREKQFGLQIEERHVFRYRMARWGMYLLLFWICLSLSGGHADFIYFQF